MAILGEGKIMKQGNPIELTDMLEGTIWTKTIANEALINYQEHFKVLSTRLVSGKTQIQIYAEFNPEDGFKAIHPDLESLYFSTLMNHKF